MGLAAFRSPEMSVHPTATQAMDSLLAQYVVRLGIEGAGLDI